MRRSVVAPLGALLATLLAALAMPAAAEVVNELVDAAADSGAGGDTAQQTLYQEALRALAEGRRTDASNTLKRLIGQAPRHAGAWLDLALIQCSLGNTDEAERLFATVETRFAPSREILELIAQQREEGCRPWTPNSTLTVSIGRGIDHNVNQGASTSTLKLEGSTIELPLQADFLPKRDDYKVIGLDYLRDVTPNGTIGFAQLQWRRNDTLHQYDTASAFGGVESPYRFGKWAVRATGLAGMVGLGGEVYQRQAQGQLRVAPPLTLPANTTFNLMGGLTYTDYRRLDNFDARTYELRPELSWHGGNVLVNASLGLLSDHGNAERPGGNRHGQFVNLVARRTLFGDGIGELAYTRQTWRSAKPYAPELLLPQIRDQQTQAVRATLTYPIAKHYSLQFEARVVHNSENISIFQYNNRQFQLSWLWQP